MKFSNSKSSPLFKEIQDEVYAYMKTQKSGRFGNHKILHKAILFFSVYILLYSLIMFSALNGSAKVLLAVLMAVNSVLIFFNFAHDASHGSLFKKKKMNRLFKYSSDLVGVSSYMWHIRHDVQHHSFTNVVGGDLIIESIPLLRLNPHQKHQKIHAFQPLYAPLLYCFYSTYWILILDFKLFLKKDICNMNNIYHPLREWIKLVFFKAFYIAYALVLPTIFLPYSLSQILAAFILAHLFSGILISLVAVFGHYMDGVEFVRPDSNGLIHNSWGEHELAVTTDFANSSSILTWLIGGLNHHICHHLFPNICHVHYKHITPIIRRKCREWKMPYKEYSLTDALSAHRKFIVNLSKP